MVKNLPLGVGMGVKVKESKRSALSGVHRVLVIIARPHPSTQKDCAILPREGPRNARIAAFIMQMTITPFTDLEILAWESALLNIYKSASE